MLRCNIRRRVDKSPRVKDQARAQHQVASFVDVEIWLACQRIPYLEAAPLQPEEFRNELGFEAVKLMNEGIVCPCRHRAQKEEVKLTQGAA
jgi:hypothetical protein